MPSSGRYEYHDLKPAAASFLDDVIAGLSAPCKALPPKYFYDARGSRLFEEICALPEYYLTRTEIALVEARAGEIAARVGSGTTLIEYGIGSGRKTALVIGATRPHTFVAIDISAEQLREAVGTLASQFPDVRLAAVCADYTKTAHAPLLEALGGSRRTLYFPGSTIGNFTVDEARDFLRNARSVAGAGGAMLIGVDLKKDPRMLHAAYNDAQGVTAAFNLNVLRRINSELGGNFDLDAFAHRAFYDPAHGRIEMHLESARAQQVTIAGRRFAFAPGETIHTESSYKYSVEEFQSLAREAGFAPAHYWSDAQDLFSIHYLTAAA
ncbi:MAG TPA: L-histidine N(alpha)-methyltransferase [Burkholderiales bacterium]|nr:L-histidine N(alpha)-methyltransferase [Burkholderiales bacterium]